MNMHPQDILQGTFLRFDATNSNKLSGPDIVRALRELRINLDNDSLARLVNWYDEDASRTIRYPRLLYDMFRGRAPASSRSESAESLSRRKLRRTEILAEKARIERKLKELALSTSKTGRGRVV